MWRCGHDVIGWSVDARDYSGQSATDIADRVLSAVGPGAIVLLHDRLADAYRPEAFARDRTIEAVELVLHRLDGVLEAVTVPELLDHGRPHRRLTTRPPAGAAPAYKNRSPSTSRCAASVSVGLLSELGPELISAWSQTQLSDPRAESPFYRPEYFQLLDEAMRADRGAGRIEVGVLPATADHGVAFLPFQRESRWRAGPAGRNLTDYQGLIGHAHRAEVVELLRRARVDEWRFDHVPITQTVLEPWFGESEPSPLIDLRDGYDAWAAERRLTTKLDAAKRQLARAQGPVRFEEATPDQAVLHRLLGWKSAQYRRTGKRDVFANSWVRAVRRASAHGPVRAFRWSSLAFVGR